jgi:hypothetical protein
MTELPKDWTDEDERAWRKEVVREIYREQEARGLNVEPTIQARSNDLLHQFEQGKVDEEQVRRVIILPYLHLG